MSHSCTLTVTETYSILISLFQLKEEINLLFIMIYLILADVDIRK